MTLSDAARAYILLTIGDGLVAQLQPDLVLGDRYHRYPSDNLQSTPDQASKQLANPLAFYIAGGILTIMGMVPGMPNIFF